MPLKNTDPPPPHPGLGAAVWAMAEWIELLQEWLHCWYRCPKCGEMRPGDMFITTGQRPQRACEICCRGAAADRTVGRILPARLAHRTWPPSAQRAS